MRSDKELEKDQMKEKTEHMCKKMKKEDLLILYIYDYMIESLRNINILY